MSAHSHDFDWLVIGSGFGGSVSALRLAEKGFRVGVLEAGRRYEDNDFARTTWNARRYYFFPKLGLKGITLLIQRLHLLLKVRGGAPFGPGQ